MKAVLTCLLFLLGGVPSASPASALFSFDGVMIGSDIQSLPAGRYTCSKGSVATEIRCLRRSSTRVFGVVPKRIEILFDKNRCYLIYIGLTPEDTPAVGKELHSMYGEPKVATEAMKGVYLASWYRETSMLVLARDIGWQKAWVSITSSDSKPFDLWPNPAVEGALRDKAVQRPSP
jgi:hypothetical protein